MPDDVGRWLEELGLGEFAEAFAENFVDADLLPRLTNSDLKDIGVVAVGHRRRLLDAIAELSEPDDETNSEAASKQSPGMWIPEGCLGHRGSGETYTGPARDRSLGGRKSRSECKEASTGHPTVHADPATFAASFSGR